LGLAKRLAKDYINPVILGFFGLLRNRNTFWF
jgi:hypothetical protein